MIKQKYDELKENMAIACDKNAELQQEITKKGKKGHKTYINSDFTYFSNIFIRY